MAIHKGLHYFEPWSSYEDDTQAAPFQTTTPRHRKILSSTDTTGISPLHTASLSWNRDSNSRHAGHEFMTITSRLQSCQVIYYQFGLAIHQNDHQARRRFVEWAQSEIAVVPDFHKRIFFSDEAHFWLNGYVNKQNCRIWSEANPQVYVETPLHPEKLTVWCALWAGGILLQKR
ncbi:uncharacterized protein TNCV_4966061 [Trichonephila clavipes]|nr:uncharacterized protein TNCV_4966061 [Trichonephila clavipes]